MYKPKRSIYSILGKIYRGGLDALYTVYLFSGVNLFGVTAVSFAASLSVVQVTSVSAFVEAFLWIELHLLAFEITGIEEDKRSKPHRPIPSGRLSLSGARSLHALLTGATLLLGIRHGLFWYSATHHLSTTLYNQYGWARNWFYKGFCNACGYACFVFGAIVCLDPHEHNSERAMRAPMIIALNVLITGSMQDFRDMDGDAAVGRMTIPILLPQPLARWLHVVTIVACSTFVCWHWESPLFAVAVIYGFAGVMTVSLLTDYSVHADRRSYKLYNHEKLDPPLRNVTLWLCFWRH
ncbi:hypothetical protein K525DRAFT_250669 [Schizophyllum commune Loenen D]|nr:hypothetical protein K525DRAFT_250669 [Schizophyllum commune Loenen D]